VVLERLRLAGDDRGEVHPQDDAGPELGLSEQVRDADLSAQLFAAFPHEGRDLRLTRLDLPAGEFPSAGKRGRSPAAGGEDASVTHDGGTDDDLHRGRLADRFRGHRATTVVMTGLTHVALAVADPGRSLHFYRDIIGIDGPVRAESDGFVISTSNGVAFTLLRGERPPGGVGDFHVGISRPDGDAVRSARARFRSIGLVEHDWSEEPGYTSVKVIDPDGYVVEVFWEESTGP
jgi:catechol 2,3-dioxygenase-like lactoylglutathione lyase family enzyme